MVTVAAAVRTTVRAAAMWAAGMAVGVNRRMAEAVQVVVPQRIQPVVVIAQGIQMQGIQSMMMMS